MVVIGIDFGSDTCILSVARQNGVHVITNDHGGRKTPSLVSYQNDRCFIGPDATSIHTGNYDRTFGDMKSYMGITNQSIPDNGLTVCPILSGDKIVYHFKTENDHIIDLVPEQVSASLLRRLVMMATRWLSCPNVTGAIIGVPPYWDHIQRQSILDTANIAKLPVLQLVNETTAVAIHYAFTRSVLLDNTTVYVMFIDIGRSATVASVVEICTGSIRVLSMAHDNTVGGRCIDTFIAEHVTAQMDHTVHHNTKTTQRIWYESERAKRELSTNNQTTVRLELGTGNTDVTVPINREDFVQMVQPEVLPRILDVVLHASKQAGVEFGDLRAIEMIGGTSRIPFIHEGVSSFLGRTVGRTCDADESITRGCALLCAIVSPSFRVRDFTWEDVTSYITSVGITTNGNRTLPDDIQIAFDVGDRIPSTKCITFHHCPANFSIVITNTKDNYTHDDILWYVPASSPPFGDTNTDIDSHHMDIRVEVGIDNSGMSHVVSVKYMRVGDDDDVWNDVRVINNVRTGIQEPDMVVLIQQEDDSVERDTRYEELDMLRNQLETMCLEIPRTITDTVVGMSSFLSPTQRVELLDMCQENMDWMEHTGYECILPDIFHTRINTIKQRQEISVDGQRRKEQLDHAIQDMKTEIMACEMEYDNYDDLKTHCQQQKKWIQDVVIEQLSIPNWVPSVVTYDAIIERIRILQTHRRQVCVKEDKPTEYTDQQCTQTNTSTETPPEN